MLTRILGAGLLAGAIAGVLVAGLQHVTTVPLILKAEVYENAAEKPAAAEPSLFRSGGEARLILVHGGEDHAAADGSEAWSPADGLERTAATTVTTVGTAVGFSLMLLAAMIAAGVPVTPRSATLWGAAAFFAAGLAPSLGLPPELPGSAAGDLVHRQLWWWGTAVATAAGIWLLFKSDGAPRIVAGLVLMVAPHVIGAPHAPAFASTAPAELAGHFASASLAVHAVMWTLTGALTGYFWQRFKGEDASY